MDCVMELSMDDIQKLFEDVDEPSAVTTVRLRLSSRCTTHSPSLSNANISRYSYLSITR
jgi:hypothetical protein